MEDTYEDEFEESLPYVEGANLGDSPSWVDLEERYYNIMALHPDLPLIENEYLDFALLMLNFNHNYPLNSLHTYRDVDKANEDILQKIIKHSELEYKHLPTKNINISLKYEPSFDFISYGISNTDILYKFKEITDDDALKAFKDEFSLVDSSLSKVSLDLLLELYRRGCRILYPRDHTALEKYEDKIIICTDLIRSLYADLTIKLNESNHSFTEKGEIILPPTLQKHIFSNLYDIESWAFLHGLAEELKKEIHLSKFKITSGVI
jgi:hypothetical protein